MERGDDRIIRYTVGCDALDRGNRIEANASFRAASTTNLEPADE